MGDPGLSRLKIIYGTLALAFFGVLAISPLKDVFREWRSVQHAYNDYVRARPVRIPEVPVRLQQLWIPELQRVDRCTNCHLGLRDTRLDDAPQPFRSHPTMYHDVESFGCTICHQGQGLSTEYTDAHLPTPFWDDPLLPHRYVEAGCGTCHRERVSESAPVLARGRELLGELGCVGCHDLPDTPAAYTPPLDGIGVKVDRAWLRRWLEDPRAFRPETRMPNFLLDEEEASVLTEFLMSFKTLPGHVRLEPLPEIYGERSEDGEFIELGKTRFREARCISCHAVEGRGGTIAPDLAKVGSKLTPAWLYNFLRAPKRIMPGVTMPRFGFDESEAAAVTAYMIDEFIDWDAPVDEQSFGTHPDFFERGLALFNRYNCSGCHALDHDRIGENRGPDLTGIGGKPLFELDFGHSKIERTRHAFIAAKLTDPRSFRDGLRMPHFGLDDPDVRAITTALLAVREETIPARFTIRETQHALFRPQGDVGEIFRRYSCLGCHTVRGDGGRIAPDLSRIGSQLQRGWVERYFRVPFSRRPIQAERMPNLFISEQEIRTLTDYFYSVFRDDSFEGIDVPTADSEAVERGQVLYWEIYGCQGCHQIGSRGGYVGPPLDGAGDRLQPGWIVRWLSNPQAYVPETIEPRAGMSLEDTRQVAAYLMSLKEEAR